MSFPEDTNPTAGQPAISRRRALGAAAAAGAGVALPALGGPQTVAAAERRADVVIVGAGFAGMTAALDLVRRGHSVVVLEARRRVGGRVHNKPIGGGEITEGGGTFTGPTQDRLMAMARRFGVGMYRTYSEGQNVYIDPNGQRSTYDGSAPVTGTAPPDPVLLADITQAITRLNEMASEIDVEQPYAAANAEAYDRQTLDSWIRENTVNPQFSDLVAAALRPIFGAEAREISLLYTLFYIAASGNEDNPGTFERNFNTQDGAQQFRFRGGSGLIVERMAKKLGRRIVLGAPVERITQTRGGVVVQARGVRVAAKRAIVAIPPSLAGRIDYSPAMPAERDQLTQRISQGTLMKVACVYPKPFWREGGTLPTEPALNGSVVSCEGPVNVTYDGSPPDGSPGVLFGFVGGDEQRAFKRMDKAARRKAVAEQFAKFVGERARRPRKYLETDWTEEVWTRGGPVGFTSPGALFALGEHLRKPVGRIHWAGTETSGYWVGYMDGAIRSGERVAAEVARRI
ncbi:FAD-dependent oxidoreductase [Thermoleophilia bacterium SCSIO 60948]|nr:FAD-dependent oxidoreductase [Thermoleophilia bacterium SCSIO 60948]